MPAMFQTGRMRKYRKQTETKVLILATVHWPLLDFIIQLINIVDEICPNNYLLLPPDTTNLALKQQLMVEI